MDLVLFELLLPAGVGVASHPVLAGIVQLEVEPVVGVVVAVLEVQGPGERVVPVELEA